MVNSLVPALLLLLAYSGTQAAWSGQSEANYFLDDMLTYPEDNYTLPDFGLDVDILVDDFLDYVQFDFSNGTASRFRRRVQRQGDCHNPYGQRVACNLNLSGLYVRYGVVRAIRSSGDKFTTAELFVSSGSAAIEISFPRGGKSKVESFRVKDLKMSMRNLPEVLVSAEVDKVFVEKTIENCERILWRCLQNDYAAFLAALIARRNSIGM